MPEWLDAIPAAVVGAVLGGLLTLVASRKRPTAILYDTTSTTIVAAGSTDTPVTVDARVNGEPVTRLYFQRYRFRYARGPQADTAHVHIEWPIGTRIYGWGARSGGPGFPFDVQEDKRTSLSGTLGAVRPGSRTYTLDVATDTETSGVVDVSTAGVELRQGTVTGFLPVREVGFVLVTIVFVLFAMSTWYPNAGHLISMFGVGIVTGGLASATMFMWFIDRTFFAFRRFVP